MRNIPNKYNIKLLLKELNFSFKFDFIYLPFDYIHNSNLGFGFINLIEEIHIIYFYYKFEGKKWKVFNSVKKFHIAYSKNQERNEIIKCIKKM